MARFHTACGTFVGWRRLPNGVRSLRQAIFRKLFGVVPRQPWIPIAAQKALAALLTRDSLVWEIGSGFSTLWMADRVGRLVSIESSKDWYERLSTIIGREGIGNIDLRYEWLAARMADFSDVADGSLDLLFVDGGPRGQCLANGFAKVKTGGHIYLDNWDTKHFWGEQADLPERRAAEIRRQVSFADYVPAQFAVYEGLLLQKA